MNFCPPNPIALAGHPPQYGQWCPYLTDSGDLYPGIICFVGATSPDRKYVAVSMIWVKPPTMNPPAPFTSHPGGFLYGGWLYEIATGQVLYIPCPPPWPDR